ncbi:N-acetylmuramoyl-L-alanine amidase [Loktanella sp. DJP18]|uniref:N-acetylmuramoyl-L-alanine amidase n=1 Tax=Loktanella sp. DJP18 TaxID=3409788 RepID=UPI003BB76A1A
MIRALVLCLALAGPAAAQDFSALARIDPATSAITDDGEGLRVVLSLSQTVPYRVFTLTDPMRVIVDFREVDFSGLIPEDVWQAGIAAEVTFGPLRPGWSRLAITLAKPMQVAQAGLDVIATSGAARLTLRLDPVDAAGFAALAGPPEAPVMPDASLAAPAPRSGPLVVAIDPGHGGIDPGATRGTVLEADLMLQLGIELADAINRGGIMRAVLTRDSDIFVSLEDRMTIARAAGAEAMLSLHADALDGDDVTRGASTYTLNAEGQDRAAQRMAERHERGDLLAGLDLTGQDDRVATVLMEMARVETGPAATRLADALIAGLRATGAEVNSRPRREGRLAVLNAADFPSVLLEAGFLSSAADRAALSSAKGRAVIVNGIVLALQDWAAAEAARAPLKRH